MLRKPASTKARSAALRLAGVAIAPSFKRNSYASSSAAQGAKYSPATS